MKLSLPLRQFYLPQKSIFRQEDAFLFLSDNSIHVSQALSQTPFI